MPRSARLQRRREYRRVYSVGVRATGRFMVAFAAPRTEPGEHSRLGVTATRRVGGAVVRARAKRRLKELFRLHPSEHPRQAVDLVLNARAGCARASWEELEGDFRHCMRTVRELLARR